jgi:hypothetical protein
MPALSVFAHFDPHGDVAPHVLAHLDALAEVSGRLLIVTTAQLIPSARKQFEARGELIERANEGYHFSSWKAGLDHAGDWAALPDLLLANDSVVGPLAPYRQILTAAGDSAVGAHGPGSWGFWGITKDLEGGERLQSYLLGFSEVTLRNPLFAAFWRGLAPLPTRAEVTARYERGIHRLLIAGGLRSHAYFVPTPREDAVGRHRRARYAFREQLDVRREQLREHGVTRLGPTGMAREVRREWRHRRISKPTRRFLSAGAIHDPMVSLWDRALDGRLPFVKISTLREDPYRIGSERMLTALEQAHPQVFGALRDYLERTRPDRACLAGTSNQLQPDRGVRA